MKSTIFDDPRIKILLPVSILGVGILMQLIKTWFVANFLPGPEFADWAVTIAFAQIFVAAGGCAAHTHFSASLVAASRDGGDGSLPFSINRVFLMWVVIAPLSVPIIAFALNLSAWPLVVSGVCLGLVNAWIGVALTPIYLSSTVTFAIINLMKIFIANLAIYAALIASRSAVAAILAEALIALIMLILVRINGKKDLSHCVSRPTQEWWQYVKSCWPYFKVAMSGVVVANIARVFLLWVVGRNDLGGYFYFAAFFAVGNQANYLASVIMGPYIRAAASKGDVEKERRLHWIIWGGALVFSAMLGILAGIIILNLIPPPFPIQESLIWMATGTCFLILGRGSAVWGVIWVLGSEPRLATLSNCIYLLMASSLLGCCFFLKPNNIVIWVLMVEAALTVFLQPLLAVFFQKFNKEPMTLCKI